MSKPSDNVWRCLVCGFAATGPAAPEACPVCGAGRDQFVAGRGWLVSFAIDMYETFLPHAVAAHIPNGVLPAAALFLILAVFTRFPGLEQASFYMLVLSVLITPVSFATGIYDWKHRYQGRRVPVFYRKVWLAVALFVLGVGAAGIRASHPALFERGGALFWIYLTIVMAMLGCAVLLGHYGGKLVFFWEKR